MSLISLIRTPARGARGPEPPPILDAPVPSRTIHPIRAFAAGRTVIGTVAGSDRLSDTLNGADRLDVYESLAGFQPGLTGPDTWCRQSTLETRDVEMVLGASLRLSAAQRAARRVFKVRYPVSVWSRSFRILGVLHLFPGIDPEHAVMGGGPRFLALTQGQVWLNDAVVDDAFDVALINRAFVRRIEHAQLLAG